MRKIDEATYAGDIAACVSVLKEVTTGETLCAIDQVSITLEKYGIPRAGDFPVAVEPKSKADQEKMGIASGSSLAQEDPSFRVKTDEESGQTIISGMGELHLEMLGRPHEVVSSVLRPTSVSRRLPIVKPFVQ